MTTVTGKPSSVRWAALQPAARRRVVLAPRFRPLVPPPARASRSRRALTAIAATALSRPDSRCRERVLAVDLDQLWRAVAPGTIDTCDGATSAHRATARITAAFAQRLAQEPHRRCQPAQPHQSRPGPRKRGVGTHLTSRPAGQQARLRPPLHVCKAGISGKSDHSAGPLGPGLLPHRRPCRRSSRPSIPPLFSGLLVRETCAVAVSR